MSFEAAKLSAAGLSARDVHSVSEIESASSSVRHLFMCFSSFGIRQFTSASLRLIRLMLTAVGSTLRANTISAITGSSV